MKKIALSIVSIFLLLFALFCSTIFLVDFNSAYRNLAEDIHINHEKIDLTKVKINKFPFPYIELDSVAEEGKIELKNIKISFSVWSLLAFNPKISSIQVGQAIMHLEHDDVSILRHDEFISELILKDLLSIETSIDKLILVESDEDIAFVFNNVTLEKNGKNTLFSANIDETNQIQGEFIYQEDDIIFNLESKTKEYDFVIQEIFKSGVFVSGSGSLDIATIPFYITRVVPKILPNIGSIEHYKNKDINIKYNLKPVENGFFIDGLKITSDSVKGEGSVILAKSKGGESKVNLEFDIIDIPSLFAKESNTRSSNYAPSINFYFLNNLTDISCNIKKLILTDSNSAENIIFQANTNASNKITLKNFSGDLDKHYKFYIDGIMTNNSFRNLFEGRVYLTYHDLGQFLNLFTDHPIDQPQKIPFAFESQVSITPVYYSLKDFNLKLDDMHVSGNYSTKFIGQQKRSNANFNFGYIEFGDESSLKMFSDITKWVENIFDGMKSDDYQNKFIPIRKINSLGDYDISIENLKYKDFIYKNVDFGLQIEPGKVSLNRLYVHDGKDWFDTDLSLDARGINPSIITRFHDGSLNVKFLSIDGLIELRKKLINQLDFSKINFITSGFISNLYDGNFSINRVIFAFNNESNIIKIPNLDFDVWKGRLQLAGSILLDPFTFNFSYGLNSADIKQVAQIFPKNLFNNKGAISANGVFSTNGDNKDKLLYNLYTNSGIIMKGLHLNNFSIDELVSKVNQQSYDKQNMEYDIDQMLLTGNTIVTDLKGNIKMTKGILEIDPIIFKTNLTSNSGKAVVNIYDYALESIFSTSFYMLHQKKFQRPSYKPINVELQINGDIISPKKQIKYDKLIESLESRYEGSSSTNLK